MTRRNYLPLGLVLGVSLLTLTVYLSALPGSFHFDDYHFLVNNPQLGKASLTKIFTDPSLFSGLGVPAYRPLTILSFALQSREKIPAPSSLLVVNIFLHVTATALTFFLAWLIFRAPLPATFASLLFGFHPLATQAVNYISCRSNLLATVFSLASLLFFLLAFSESNSQDSSASSPKSFSPLARNSWCPIVFSLAAIFFFGLGLLAKEEVFGLPLIVFFSAVLLPGKTQEKKDPWLVVAGLFLVSLLYLGLRRAVAVSVLVPASPLRPIPANLATGLLCQWHYLELFFWPFSLSVIHDFNPPKNFFEPPVLAVFLLWLLLLIFSFWQRRREPLLFLGLVWFFAGLLPTTTLVPLRNPLAEHHAYLSLVGLSLLFTDLIFRLPPLSPLTTRSWLLAPGSPPDSAATGLFPKYRLALLGLGLLLFSSLLATTARRCREWRSELSLWKAAVRKAPTNPANWVNLAVTWWERGEVRKSKTALEKAMKLDPEFVPARSNLGRLLVDEGKISEGITLLVSAYQKEPRDPQINYNLARAYALAGKPRLAELHYFSTLRVQPFHQSACQGLASVYVYQLREPNKAKAVISQCLAQNPAAREDKSWQKLSEDLEKMERGE